MFQTIPNEIPQTEEIHSAREELTAYLIPLTTKEQTSTFKICPSPTEPRAQINHASWPCSGLPSTDPNFRLSICHSKQRCNAFQLNVIHTGCDARNKPHFTNTELQSFVGQKYGPDAFILMTEGTEKYVSEEPVYKGDCKYTFNVALQNGGNATVALWQTYEVSRCFLNTWHPQEE